MEYLFAWFILSFLVGLAGSSRTIGFFGALLLSLFFSPLIGVIGVALSQREKSDERQFNEQNYHRVRKQSNDDEERRQYERLKWMRDKGVLSEQEFLKKRDELFNSNR